jgi:hypothetical protein
MTDVGLAKPTKRAATGKQPPWVRKLGRYADKLGFWRLAMLAAPVRAPRVRKLASFPHGTTLTIDAGAMSLGVNSFAAQADRIRSGFRAHHLELTTPRPGTVELSLFTSDPLRHKIRLEDIQQPDRPGYIATAMDMRGQAVPWPLWLPKLWVGAQGAGKSSEIWAAIAVLQSLEVPFRLRVFDPKGGQEFVDMDGNAYMYERDPSKWPAFLQSTIRALEARQAAMRSRKQRRFEPTEDEPWDITVIDELVSVLAFSESKAKIRIGGDSHPVDVGFRVFLSQARSAGYTGWFASQLLQKAIIGPLADLIPQRTVLRVTSDDQVRMADMDPKLCPAHEIPAEEWTAGVGYTLSSLGMPVRHRAAYLGDRERAAAANRMRATTERQLKAAKWHDEGAA